jgi:hypothetical protein
MKQTLWLVWDVSGSMVENGKRFIARSVVRMTEQYCRLGYGIADLKLAAWSDDARIIEWNPDDEFPAEMLHCEGGSSVRALVTLLGEQPNGKVMLVTDGWWTSEDMKALKGWKDRLPPETLRVIKVGSDASLQLKGADVFAAEDLPAALDDWLQGGGE